MRLTFPTQAEQLEAAYKAGTVRSIARQAKLLGADREVRSTVEGKEIIYTFDDDTTLHTRGHGWAYRVWAELP
jgi:hypothetical protein